MNRKTEELEEIIGYHFKNKHIPRKKLTQEEIKREDIVSLLKENGQFVLVYYK